MSDCGHFGKEFVVQQICSIGHYFPVGGCCGNIVLLCCVLYETVFLGFPTMSGTNWPIHPQKKARIMKFWI